jgi:MraZ protein
VFQGSYSINMDAKGRLAVPAKCRDLLADVCSNKIVMTAHIHDRCVSIYPEPEWEKNVLPKVKNLPTAYKKAQRAQRLIIGYANALEIDANGRVLIPPTLRDFAGLEKKLMLVGLGNKFELWSEDAWWASINDDDDDEPMPNEMLSLSL